MIDINLPFWLGGDEIKKLIAAAKVWWARVELWAQWPLSQFDPLLCHLTILNLLAWQRDISRFESEVESLYRLRVKYALINAQDAGYKNGFVRIFSRLGIGYLEIYERTDPVNWDVIILRISENQLAQNTSLLNHIVEKYGRTCRRYQFETITPIDLTIETKATGNQWDLAIATL